MVAIVLTCAGLGLDGRGPASAAQVSGPLSDRIGRHAEMQAGNAADLAAAGAGERIHIAEAPSYRWLAPRN